MNSLITRFLGTAFVATALVPKIASAQTAKLTSFLTQIQNIINAILPIIAALALVAFFAGLAIYVFKANDDEAKAKGKNIMIAGIVALFLMAAIGGIVQFLTEATGTNTGTVNIVNPIK
jgi:cation transporter-like permease